MPLIRPSLQDISARIKSDMSALLLNNKPVVRKSFLWVTAYVFSGAIHLCYGVLVWISRQLFAATADTESLEINANENGIYRRAAAFATGGVVFTGSDGTVIPVGTRMQSPDGIYYATTEAGEIDSGEVSVEVMADESGIVGNLTVGVQLALVSPIENVNANSVVDTAGLTGGVDAETDDELRERVLFKKRFPPQGGAIQDYIGWALEVSGVYKTFAFPCYGGPETDPDIDSMGYVGVPLLVASGNHIPSGATVTAVQNYLNIVRPATATPVAYAPEALPISVTFTSLSPNTSANRAAIAAALDEFIVRKGFPDMANLEALIAADFPPMVIALSQLHRVIGGVLEDGDYVLSAPTANVSVPKNNFPVLTVTWPS